MDFVKLISYLFHSRTQAHIFHLQTQSFAEHMALNVYYDDIVPLIDGIVKGYSNFNLMEYNNTQQVVAYLDMLCKAVYEVYQSTEDTNIQNLLDGITDLIKSTIYKLQNLH